MSVGQEGFCLDRRTFLLGSLMPACALAAFEGPKVRPGFGVPQKGRTGAFAVTPLTVPVGLESPFTALHVSDTHLNFADLREVPVGSPQYESFQDRWMRFPHAFDNFVATLDYAERRGLPIFHTGDLYDSLTEANSAAVRRARGALRFDAWAVGNHEFYRGWCGHRTEVTGACDQLAREFGRDTSFSVFERGGAWFVSFDNVAEGRVSEGVVARVRKVFDDGRPVVLLCHVPPVDTPEMLAAERERLRYRLLARGDDPKKVEEYVANRRRIPVQDGYDEGSRRFYDFLRRQPQLKAILCGHRHAEYHVRFSDTAEMHVVGGNFDGCAYEISFV